MAARAAWFGVTLNKGQTCLAVRRIFVDRSVYDRFLDELRPLAASARPLALMLWSQAEQAERLMAEAVRKGASLLGVSEVPKAEDEPPRYPPTFVIAARPEMAICREASFAPVAAVIPFNDFDEVIHAQAECPYALGASLFMQDLVKAREFAASLDCGSVSINDVIVGTAHPATPFGGRKASGWGVTQGAEGLLAMTTPVVVAERGGTYRPHYASADASNPSLTLMLNGMLNWKPGRNWGQRWKGFWKMFRNLFG
ncbi:MAG: aldehyde dehydrogenase family protein [Planctomycetes bacterium]|nr:aldehyde dehydrogenase family protein [Planctomycetota bacterium]